MDATSLSTTMHCYSHRGRREGGGDNEDEPTAEEYGGITIITVTTLWKAFAAWSVRFPNVSIQLSWFH